MRKLLKMTDSEGQEKVSEKNLLTRGLVTLTVVILCLAAMTLTAFAYYSLDIVSGSNKIKAAVFDVNVLIVIIGSAALGIVTSFARKEDTK